MSTPCFTSPSSCTVTRVLCDGWQGLWGLHADTPHSIKKWKCPEGIFVNNFVGHEAIINTMSLNTEGVMFSGGESAKRVTVARADEMQPTMEP